MPTIDEEIARIDAQIAALTKLKGAFDLFDGDVAEFIRQIEDGVITIENDPVPRTTAAIIGEWEVFKAARG